jgi:hypothetical protein
MEMIHRIWLQTKFGKKKTTFKILGITYEDLLMCMCIIIIIIIIIILSPYVPYLFYSLNSIMLCGLQD